jgi:hypothetical protein
MAPISSGMLIALVCNYPFGLRTIFSARVLAMRSCTLTGIKHVKMKNDKNYPDMPASEGLPCISLILPFEPNMNNEKGLFNLLTIAANKAEINLLNDYSEKQVAEVIKKLR